MIPTVTQQLRTVRARLEQTVAPALPEEAGFAREQTLLIMATLDWLVDVHEHEYRYQVSENADYRAVIGELAPDDPDARALLGYRAPAPEDVAVPLADLAEQNRQLKEVVARVHAAAATGDDPAVRRRAHDAVVAVARRQRDRELSWYRMTGFPGARPDIAEVLDRG